MTDVLKQEIARVLDQWFIEHDGEEIDCPALATAALSVVQPRIERLEAERDFLLLRASRAGSCSFGADRWTGASSNALVEVAFGGKNDRLPSDGNDLSACYLTVMMLPEHLRTDAVFAQLEVGEAEVAAKYPDAGIWAKENAKWPGRAALTHKETEA